jgi:hypothetical protein
MTKELGIRLEGKMIVFSYRDSKSPRNKLVCGPDMYYLFDTGNVMYEIAKKHVDILFYLVTEKLLKLKDKEKM